MYFWSHVHVVSCIFIIEIICVLLAFTEKRKKKKKKKKKKNLVYMGFLEYVANAHGSWF